MAKIALVDDHVVLRRGLANLIESLEFEIAFEANNGDDFLYKLNQHGDPDLVLMDINMPYKDGFETTLWLKRNKPHIKVLALSMLDDESAIIRMMKNGAKGYVLKEIEPAELKIAINEVLHKGFHYTDLVTGKLMNSISKMSDDNDETATLLKLNEKEITFLKWAATELTYKEVAAEMKLSPRTIDGYRDSLFEKLNVKTRVGLAMYAIKHGIVHI